MSSPLQRFVNAFNVGLTLRMIYFARHPSVLAAAQNLTQALGDLTAERGVEAITLGQAKGRLVFEGRAVLALTPLARRLIEFLKVFDSGAFRFSQETSVEECLTLFSLYAETRTPMARAAARELLASQNVTHVALLPPLAGGGAGALAGLAAELLGKAGGVGGGAGAGVGGGLGGEGGGGAGVGRGAGGGAAGSGGGACGTGGGAGLSGGGGLGGGAGPGDGSDGASGAGGGGGETVGVGSGGLAADYGGLGGSGLAGSGDGGTGGGARGGFGDPGGARGSSGAGGSRGPGGGGDGEVALPVIALAGDGLSELDLQAYHSLMAVVDTNHVQASHGGTIDVAGARARAEQLVQQDLERLHDLMRLAQYPDFDAYTVGHSVRVALLVTLVAERLGLPKERMVELAAAALLHDVGKAQVPYDILFKPGPLNADERRIMETHPRLGGEMLLASGVANPWSVCAAFGHHVRHDRRGYPKLPVWARQSSATALIHVCDVFEALSAVRPYKPAFAPWDAYDIMVRDQGGFDPGALRVFVNAIGLFPPGSNVVLSDGSEGFVVRAGERPDRPSVQIRKRADGVAVDLDAAETCDLSDPANAELRVVRLLAPVHDAAESEEAAAVEAELARRPRSGPAEPIPIDPCDPAPA